MSETFFGVVAVPCEDCVKIDDEYWCNMNCSPVTFVRFPWQPRRKKRAAQQEKK